MYVKKTQKALFHVNKALAIDKIRLYWKRFANDQQKQMNLFEEAEFGFRKAVEFGVN
jgi:hypothetical protein